LAGTFTGSIRTKAHGKFGRKWSVGVSRDCMPKYFEHPLLSKERVKQYELQIWQVNSQGPSEQKPMKNLGENGAWAYPGSAGAAPIF